MSYSFRKFEPFTDVLKPFDCGNADLNGFLLESSGDIPNATTYDRQMLASTYVVAYHFGLFQLVARQIGERVCQFNQLEPRITQHS